MSVGILAKEALEYTLQLFVEYQAPSPSQTSADIKTIPSRLASSSCQCIPIPLPKATQPSFATRLKYTEHFWDVLKTVTFSEDVSTLPDLENMSAVTVIVPVVVDEVEVRVCSDLDLGGTSAGVTVIDVVALHGDELVGSVGVDTPGPVMVPRNKFWGIDQKNWLYFGESRRLV